VKEDRVPPPGLDSRRDLVPHAAARNEERGLLAENGRRFLLEQTHGGIVAQHVVADFGFRHGAPHGGRGTGHRIASQVNRMSAQEFPVSLNRPDADDSLNFSRGSEPTSGPYGTEA
jgi:hypothetical protein